MKVLLINGSPRANGNTAAALGEMAAVFTQEGMETEIIQVGNKDIRGCIACGGCGAKGKCVFEDLVNETSPKFQGHPRGSPRSACGGRAAGGDTR